MSLSLRRLPRRARRARRDGLMSVQRQMRVYTEARRRRDIMPKLVIAHAPLDKLSACARFYATSTRALILRHYYTRHIREYHTLTRIYESHTLSPAAACCAQQHSLARTVGETPREGMYESLRRCRTRAAEVVTCRAARVEAEDASACALRRENDARVTPAPQYPYHAPRDFVKWFIIWRARQ